MTNVECGREVEGALGSHRRKETLLVSGRSNRAGLVVLVTFELGPGDQEFMAGHLQDLKSLCKGRVREEVGQQDKPR